MRRKAFCKLPIHPPGVVPAGTGPRHLAFGPGGTMVYVNGEMGRNVTTFKRDVATGELTALQTLPLVPGVNRMRR